MLIYTTHIKRTVALAGALIAIGAPSASARPADGQNVPAPAPAIHSRESDYPSMGGIAARREAIAAANWQAANPSTVVDVHSSGNDGGLELASAAIGAAIALTLVLAQVAGSWVLRRRRQSHGRHQLA
jgi:hydrogenase maturation factor HypE